MKSGEITEKYGVKPPDLTLLKGADAITHASKKRSSSGCDWYFRKKYGNTENWVSGMAEKAAKSYNDMVFGIGELRLLHEIFKDKIPGGLPIFERDVRKDIEAFTSVYEVKTQHLRDYKERLFDFLYHERWLPYLMGSLTPELRCSIESAVNSEESTLTPREKSIINQLYLTESGRTSGCVGFMYEGRRSTKADSGRVENVGRERMRQIEKKAIRKLRQSIDPLSIKRSLGYFMDPETIGRLKNNGIETIIDLCFTDLGDIIGMKGIGPERYYEIREARKKGFKKYREFISKYPNILTTPQ